MSPQSFVKTSLFTEVPRPSPSPSGSVPGINMKMQRFIAMTNYQTPAWIDGEKIEDLCFWDVVKDLEKEPA